MLSDRDIAIRILAMDECQAADDPAGFLDHFSRNFDSWAHMEHSGDCTKHPWTCMRCVHRDTLAKVPAVRKLFGLAQSIE